MPGCSKGASCSPFCPNYLQWPIKCLFICRYTLFAYRCSDPLESIFHQASPHVMESIEARESYNCGVMWNNSSAIMVKVMQFLGYMPHTKTDTLSHVSGRILIPPNSSLFRSSPKYCIVKKIKPLSTLPYLEPKIWFECLKSVLWSEYLLWFHLFYFLSIDRKLRYFFCNSISFDVIPQQYHFKSYSVIFLISDFSHSFSKHCII